MSSRRPAQAARTGALLGALLLAAPLGLVTLAGPPAQAATGRERAAPTCNGLSLTAEGSPNGTVIGTAGDDVILTRGATRVDAGAGNDSICVTGKGTAVINAGPGDDFVGARAHKGKSFVSLGFGDDEFYGGEGNDRVWSQEASNQSSPDDTDHIDTGVGDDYVISGSSTALNSDIVTLGPGDDALVTYGSSGGASLSGGLGVNFYQPLPGLTVSGDWVFDNVTGQASKDDVAQIVWSSFQRFDLRGLHGPSVRFLGSRAHEWVVAGGTCRAVLRGRQGADRLTVDPDGCNNLPAGDARLLGGPGNDQLKGSLGDDVLKGGAGNDRGDGGLGTNTCDVEIRVACSG